MPYVWASKSKIDSWDSLFQVLRSRARRKKPGEAREGTVPSPSPNPSSPSFFFPACFPRVRFNLLPTVWMVPSWNRLLVTKIDGKKKKKRVWVWVCSGQPTVEPLYYEVYKNKKNFRDVGGKLSRHLLPLYMSNLHAQPPLVSDHLSKTQNLLVETTRKRPPPLFVEAVL